jgi:outer membrane protein OmpA-like peptidoglycan-associated protein
MNIQASQLHSMEGNGEKLSYDRYEAVLELYQAENVVQIARSLGADQYAPDSIGKATALLSQAQDMNARKMDTHAIVSGAREAAQMAEDARTIAVKRRDEEQHAREIERSQNQSELRRRAEEDAAQARADAQAETQQAAQAREDAAQAEAQARAAQQAVLAPPPPPPTVQRQTIVAPLDKSRMQFRAQLLAQLNGTLITQDTPRGLVATVGDSMFESGNDTIRPDAGARLRNIATILSSHPELTVRVEGYADVEGLSEERAQAVRAALIARGARPDSIVAVGYGNSRPIASNATAAGRGQNRRVEVVIYGDSIGNKALWDRPYSLRSQR